MWTLCRFLIVPVTGMIARLAHTSLKLGPFHMLTICNFFSFSVALCTHAVYMYKPFDVRAIRVLLISRKCHNVTLPALTPTKMRLINMRTIRDIDFTFDFTFDLYTFCITERANYITLLPFLGNNLI